MITEARFTVRRKKKSTNFKTNSWVNSCPTHVDVKRGWKYFYWLHELSRRMHYDACKCRACRDENIFFQKKQSKIFFVDIFLFGKNIAETLVFAKKIVKWTFLSLTPEILELLQTQKWVLKFSVFFSPTQVNHLHDCLHSFGTIWKKIRK